jgi:multiple sugar transport system ATP-binding protein
VSTSTGGSNDLDPKDRHVAMVFQSDALYPSMTVATNMGFSLEHRGATKAEVAERVNWAASIPVLPIF